VVIPVGDYKSVDSSRRDETVASDTSERVGRTLEKGMNEGRNLPFSRKGKTE